jgi:hypothetical protein
MKKYINIKTLLIVLAVTMVSASCKKDDMVTPDPFVGLSFKTEDQFGRPAINTVFVGASDKDIFNTTTVASMGAAFQSKFQARLLALNAGYTTNALGLNAATFTTVLATDVLTASTTGKTTFFDGTNVLTGRLLADDVIDVELLLIFGGSTGASNPQLTSDKVNANDKPFLTSFPYMATAW